MAEYDSKKVKKLVDAAIEVCSNVDPDELRRHWPELATAVKRLGKALDGITGVDTR